MVVRQCDVPLCAAAFELELVAFPVVVVVIVLRQFRGELFNVLAQGRLVQLVRAFDVNVRHKGYLYVDRSANNSNIFFKFHMHTVRLSDSGIFA